MKHATAPQAGDEYGTLNKLEHFQVTSGTACWCALLPGKHFQSTDCAVTAAALELLAEFILKLNPVLCLFNFAKMQVYGGTME